MVCRVYNNTIVFMMTEVLNDDDFSNISHTESVLVSHQTVLSHGHIIMRNSAFQTAGNPKPHIRIFTQNIQTNSYFTWPHAFVVIFRYFTKQALNLGHGWVIASNKSHKFTGTWLTKLHGTLFFLCPNVNLGVSNACLWMNSPENMEIFDRNFITIVFTNSIKSLSRIIMCIAWRCHLTINRQAWYLHNWPFG